jgi:hypothetical protein
MIGFGAADLDAAPPLRGRLAEVRAVGEVEQDRPCGVHQFGDAGGA